MFGRWKPDETDVVLKAAESKATGSPIEIPGWMSSLALTVICGGIAIWVAYVGPDAKANPIRPWLVIGCTVLGLGIGCAVWWMSGSEKR